MIGLQKSGYGIDVDSGAGAEEEEIFQAAKLTGIPINEEAHFPVVDHMLDRWIMATM